MCAATIRLLAEALADRFSKVRSFAFVELLDDKTDAAATASNVVEISERMSLAEAASLLSVATAHLTLARLAGVRPGQRMLVHSAAGGGGLAAVSVARWLGAEVYATAGSPRRRDFLREREIVHVGDSRTTSFADDDDLTVQSTDPETRTRAGVGRPS